MKHYFLTLRGRGVSCHSFCLPSVSYMTPNSHPKLPPSFTPKEALAFTPPWFCTCYALCLECLLHISWTGWYSSLKILHFEKPLWTPSMRLCQQPMLIATTMLFLYIKTICSFYLQCLAHRQSRFFDWLRSEENSFLYQNGGWIRWLLRP